MKTIFLLLFQGIIIAGMAGMGYLIFEGVISTTNKLERMVRGVAIATGIFVYGAADAVGVSLTNFITTAIDNYS